MLSFLISMNGLGVFLNCFDLKVFPKSSDVTLWYDDLMCFQVWCMFHPVPFDKFPGYSWKARWVMSLVWLGCINSLGIHMLPEPPQAAPIEATQQPFKKEYGGLKSYHPIMMEELLMRAVFPAFCLTCCPFSRCLVSVLLRPFQVFLIRSWDSFSIWHLLPEVTFRELLKCWNLNHWNVQTSLGDKKSLSFCEKKKGRVGKGCQDGGCFFSAEGKIPFDFVL